MGFWEGFATGFKKGREENRQIKQRKLAEKIIKADPTIRGGVDGLERVLEMAHQQKLRHLNGNHCH
jgi:hypothetical protein